jgi:hypothetical protein
MILYAVSKILVLEPKIIIYYFVGILSCWLNILLSFLCVYIYVTFLFVYIYIYVCVCVYVCYW